jgi:hypothetical protein
VRVWLEVGERRFTSSGLLCVSSCGFTSSRRHSTTLVVVPVLLLYPRSCTCSTSSGLQRCPSTTRCRRLPPPPTCARVCVARIVIAHALHVKVIVLCSPCALSHSCALSRVVVPVVLACCFARVVRRYSTRVARVYRASLICLA